MTSTNANRAAPLPDLPSPAEWAEHALWWSERCRSRALLWKAGEDWFSNDPLGPKPHTHPNASEIFLVASGLLRLTVGRTQLELGAGGFCLVPPDTYHEPLNVGDSDCCVFVLVAPNWRDCRWKPEGFVDADFQRLPRVASVSEPGPLPSDELIESGVLALEPNESKEMERPDADHLVYVLGGTTHVTVEHISGPLAPHQFLTVMGGTKHLVAANDEPVRLLSIWAVEAPAL